MIRFMKWAMPGLLIAGGLLAMNPVAAQASSTLVYFNDLNLASPSGLATLQHRIDQAVTMVCGGSASADTPRAIQDIRHCRADALSSAQLQVALLTNRSRQLAVREGAVVIASR